MKRVLQYIILGILVWGCIDDESKSLYPENNPNFSRITITSLSDTVSVDVGQEPHFKPTILQTIEEKPLSYRWTANLLDPEGALGKEFECGTGETLDYLFTDRGEYKLKLEVKNEDYSEVKSWLLEVRAYDRGFFVAGNDETGKSTISFARELSPDDLSAGKEMTFATDIVGKVNPEYDIQHVVRVCKAMKQRGGGAILHIFTRDKIYVADPETFEIYWVADFAARFPGETIVDVGFTDTEEAAHILTSKNRMICYNKDEFALYELEVGKTNISSIYADAFYVDMFNSAFGYLQHYWVKDGKIFSSIADFAWYGWNPVVNNTSGIVNGLCVDGVISNVYEGYDILDIVQMNGDFLSGQIANVFSISKKKGTDDHYMIVEFDNMSYNSSGIILTSLSEAEFDCPGATYRKGMRMVPNGRYNAVYYADGQDVFVWYPRNLAPNNIFPDRAAFSLGAGKEVTCMRVSLDMRELYVGFYDHNSGEALKGGLYIYDALEIGTNQNLQPKKKFENITTRPVDILYKTLAKDEYIPYV